MWGKSKWSTHQFQYILIALDLDIQEKQTIKIQTVDPETSSILKKKNEKKGLGLNLHHILCMIFKGKSFASYILSTDHI